MKHMIELKHEHSVKVAADFKIFCQNNPASIRLQTAVHFIQVAVHRAAAVLAFHRLHQTLHMVRIKLVIIPQITDIFSAGVGQGLIKGIRQPAIFRPINKGQPPIRKPTHHVLHGCPSIPHQHHLQMRPCLRKNTFQRLRQILRPVVGADKNTHQRTML